VFRKHKKKKVESNKKQGRIRSALSNKDLMKRIGFTLVVLFIYKIGLSITVPNAKLSNMVGNVSNASWLNLISLIGGGGLENFSVLSLGVTPYITASIIIQMFSMDVFPYFTELAKQGNSGKKKLESYTRYLAVIFAFLQSISLIYTIKKNYSGVLTGADSASQVIYISVIFTAGSFIMIWLGDQMSQKGVGNGMSMLIAAGIIGRLPEQFIESFQSLCGSDSAIEHGVWIFVGYVVAYLIIIILVTLLNSAERRIPIQYTSSSLELAEIESDNYLPLKVNSASVMPVIFASSIMLAPVQLASFFLDEDKLEVMNNWLGMSTWYSLVIYAVLILLFTFFYVKMQINPEKLSEDIGKSGAYIPGIRPGKETQRYIDTVLSRITVLGSIALVLIALLPNVLPLLWSDMPSSLSLGGTGMIIVVGVALETSKQISGILTQDSYKKYYNK
jgi:preprotein translocase subunit SecY